MLCHDIQPHAESGGMSIIGVFIKLSIDRLPGTLNPLFLAVRLRGTVGESGACSVVVRNPDGEILRTVPDDQITLTVGYVDFTVNLGPISLRKPGMYSIGIVVDGIELRSVPMLLDKVQLM